MSSGRKYAQKKDAQRREELSHEDYDFGSKDEKGRKKDDSDDSDDSDDEKFNSTSFLSTKIFSDDEEEREDDADDGDFEEREHNTNSCNHHCWRVNPRRENSRGDTPRRVR